MHYLSVLVDASANETATRTHDLLQNATKKGVCSMNEMQLIVTMSATKTKRNVKMKIVSPTSGRSLSANGFRDALTHVNSRSTHHCFL
jgi:hypothetical protein